MVCLRNISIITLHKGDDDDDDDDVDDNNNNNNNNNNEIIGTDVLEKVNSCGVSVNRNVGRTINLRDSNLSALNVVEENLEG